MTVIITNEPVKTASTDMSALERRGDTFVTWRASVFPESATGLGAPRTFEDEKKAFGSMLPLLYSRHAGEYVAVARGTIVDHDRSRVQLVRRFFGRFSGTPVYVGFVGPRDVAKVPTPIIRRSR